MGGHGGLNILPQKSWHVYNLKNKLKVDKDKEKVAQAEEQAEKGAVTESLTNRLAKLRHRRARQGPTALVVQSSGGTGRPVSASARDEREAADGGCVTAEKAEAPPAGNSSDRGSPHADPSPVRANGIEDQASHGRSGPATEVGQRPPQKRHDVRDSLGPRNVADKRRRVSREDDATEDASRITSVPLLFRPPSPERLRAHQEKLKRNYLHDEKAKSPFEEAKREQPWCLSGRQGAAGSGYRTRSQKDAELGQRRR